MFGGDLNHRRAVVGDVKGETERRRLTCFSIELSSGLGLGDAVLCNLRLSGVSADAESPSILSIPLAGNANQCFRVHKSIKV